MRKSGLWVEIKQWLIEILCGGGAANGYAGNEKLNESRKTVECIINGLGHMEERNQWWKTKLRNYHIRASEVGDGAGNLNFEEF